MKALLLDIDGTTLLGAQPLPGALELRAWLRARGLPHLWVTNNTSFSRGGWLDRLARAGLEPRPDEVYTAGDATVDLLRRRDPAARVHLVGTADLAADFAAGGVRLVAADENPDVLVLGYDTGITYEKIRAAALLLRGGVRFLATHPDLNCPSPAGPVPDVGSFLALFEAACGRRPEVVGKPQAAMAVGALARLGVEPRDAVMVGDRLETDTRMAHEAGMASWLVLTGASSAADVDASAVRPTRVFPSLVEVLAHLQRA